METPVKHRSLLPPLLALLLLSACNDRTQSPPELPEIDSGQRDADEPPPSDADRSDTAMDPWKPPGTFDVVVEDSAPEGVQIAATDVAEYLGEMGIEATLVNVDPGCSDGEGAVVFTEFAGESPQSWSIGEQRCGGGVRVELSGSGLLGRQYAAYAFLHELGVRFFHPEEEFVPAVPAWPAEPLSMQVTPAFESRSVSLHLTHPLELGDPIRLGEEAYKEEARRYIDWQIKNFASFGTSGVSHFADLEDYGVRRGFPRSTGFSLHNQQQGGGGIIDPDSPLSDEEQIAAAIDERMGNDPDAYPEHFHFTFNPSEFTEIDDETIVRQLTFIADYMAETYPDTVVMTTNHGTAGEPTENYGVRFYDLPKFAPKNLGVKVHTLMFYDLERPAPVYGNENFNNLFDFMEEQYTERRIWYFPESAWWLTFDIPVPLYLPITIEARDRDLQNIRHMLEGGLDGHRVFGTGHEWGYWQNEYCSLRMSADLEYRWQDCIADIAAPAGEFAPEVKAAVEGIVSLQQDHMFDREMLRWLVGTDEETELAAQIGIAFHPLPPLPSEMMGWSADEIDAWETDVAPRLDEIAAAYEPIVASLRAVEDELDSDSVAFSIVDEIADGAEANMLRARHARQVYGAVVAMRKHRLGIGADQEMEAVRLLDEADQTTADVARITRSRSDFYRYKPRTRAIGGGEDGSEDENWTGYSYRYLNRAHHAFYYRRIDNLAREAIEGLGEPFEVNTVVLAPDQELLITLLDDAITDVTTDLGDSATTTERLVTHIYDVPGLFSVTMDGMLEGNTWSAEFDVAHLETHYFTGRTGVLIEPQTDLSGQIEAVLPALVVGPLGDGRFVFGTAPADEPVVEVGGFAVMDEVATSGDFETAVEDVEVPLSVGGEASMALTVRNAKLSRDAMPDAPIVLQGDLTTQAIVDALVGLSGGAFDEASARDLVADALGYTADTLPETVPFTVEYQVETRTP